MCIFRRPFGLERSYVFNACAGDYPPARAGDGGAYGIYALFVFSAFGIRDAVHACVLKGIVAGRAFKDGAGEIAAFFNRKAFGILVASIRNAGVVNCKSIRAGVINARVVYAFFVRGAGGVVHAFDLHADVVFRNGSFVAFQFLAQIPFAVAVGRAIRGGLAFHVQAVVFLADLQVIAVGFRLALDVRANRIYAGGIRAALRIGFAGVPYLQGMGRAECEEEEYQEGELRLSHKLNSYCNYY